MKDEGGRMKKKIRNPKGDDSGGIMSSAVRPSLQKSEILKC
jgi:hypothetical protein